jgi:predicted Rdx family selenoprotein
MSSASWRLVLGRNRCTQCGELVESAWLAFTAPATWTLALCEPCVAALTETENPE